MPLPPRKKKPDFALLMGEPEDKPLDPLDDAEPDEDDDDFADMEEEEDLSTMDPLDDMADDGAPGLDPEQAALAETLGFSDPEQQQALVDLIKLVTSADPMATESSSELPPLPESTY
jgi:hypothetical protein